jgi:acyl-CoA reductase-like NAD-dependent aldehyde dehydrogenase
MNAKLWIGGRPVSALSGATATVLNPADGRPLARVAEAGPEDADAAAARPLPLRDRAPHPRERP